MRQALEDYPAPSPDVARPPANLDEDAKRRLAALGYVSAGAAPVVRKDAPRPADMSSLFPVMDRASGLFAAGQDPTRRSRLKDKIRAADPYNIDAMLRLATSYSSLGRDAAAEETFGKAAALAPKSQDVRTYLALHYARTKDWERAVPLLEQVVADSPDCLTAVDALGELKAREGLRAMEAGDNGGRHRGVRAVAPAARRVVWPRPRTGSALSRRKAFRRCARSARPGAGCVSKPADDALQARAAQRAAERARLGWWRIARAREKADATTRDLIARERLFR